MEMIDRGLAEARREEGDFFPSVGKFIGWCVGPKEHYEHKRMSMAEKYNKKNRDAKRLEDLSPERKKEVAAKNIAEMRKSLRGNDQ